MQGRLCDLPPVQALGRSLKPCSGGCLKEQKFSAAEQCSREVHLTKRSSGLGLLSVPKPMTVPVNVPCPT